RMPRPFFCILSRVTTLAETLALAAAHYNAGRFAEAEVLARRILTVSSREPHANFLLGRCRLAARDPLGAEAAFRTELERDPNHMAALCDRGVALFELERLAEAEACFRRAAEVRPDFAPARNNLAAILVECGDPDTAAVLYEAAVARDPDYAEAYSNRLMCEQYRVSVTPKRLLALSRGWDQRYAPRPAPSRPATRPPCQHEPLRVGFLSTDFCRAPVGYFLAGFVSALDKSMVEALLYSDTPTSDDLSRDLARAATSWHETRGLADAALLAAIREDRLDVLIDLGGHTRGNRLPLFARRAAPVQVSWAGYPGTTGLSAMDYLIADWYEVPEGDERFYSETVLRLPNDYICYGPPSYAPAVGGLPAACQGFVTFSAFHNAAKCGPQSIALWARAMREVPGSRIILKYKKLDAPANESRIKNAFAAVGIAPERITIEGTTPHLAMLRRYGDADIALDSLPYSGGLTTCEALWMGVPVVTLPGRTFAGRHSLSHVMNVGLSQLAARDDDDYVRIVAELARDLERLADLRRDLRPMMAASPLCDGARFARDFTALLRQVTRA
ncbi:MAG: tetratricopeptide repeat protein, partial [Stellaceae bacterium]